MDIKFNLTLPKLDGMDASQMMSALRKASPEIAKEVERRIRARAKRDFSHGYSQGAIGEDISSKPYKGDVSGKREVTLVSWYVAEENQIAEWGRIYAPYQEGEPLGKHTWTHGMHQFLGKVDPEDIPSIYAWADATLRAAADDLAANANANATTLDM